MSCPAFTFALPPHQIRTPRSDPVIEPMLQTVPDPFDSYGPPPSDDKIFSILPPLSVIANTPSATPSPMTSSTPELESSSDGKNSWTNTAGGFFPETAAAWANVTTSPSMSPTSSSSVISPSASPPTVSRRHSVPFVASTSPTHSHRKSESKLRSVLAVIDESSRSAHPSHDDGPGDLNATVRGRPGGTAVDSEAMHVNGVKDLRDADTPWGTTRLLTDPPDTRGDTTPRGSLRIPSLSPSPPSPDTPSQERALSPKSDQTAVPSS